MVIEPITTQVRKVMAFLDLVKRKEVAFLDLVKHIVEAFTSYSLGVEFLEASHQLVQSVHQ